MRNWHFDFVLVSVGMYRYFHFQVCSSEHKLFTCHQLDEIKIQQRRKLKQTTCPRFFLNDRAIPVKTMFIPTRELCSAKFIESVLANIFYSSCKLTLLMKALLASVWDSANETCLSSTSTLSVVASLTANFIAILSTVSFCLWRRDFANLRIAMRLTFFSVWD